MMMMMMMINDDDDDDDDDETGCKQWERLENTLSSQCMLGDRFDNVIGDPGSADSTEQSASLKRVGKFEWPMFDWLDSV